LIGQKNSHQKVQMSSRNSKNFKVPPSPNNTFTNLKKKLNFEKPKNFVHYSNKIPVQERDPSVPIVPVMSLKTFNENQTKNKENQEKPVSEIELEFQVRTLNGKIFNYERKSEQVSE
jgi:hypothetical protein